MSFVPTSTANLSSSDNKWYKAELARRHWDRSLALTAKRKEIAWVPSLKRGENHETEKIGETSVEKRGRMPERSGLLSWGGLHCRHWAAMSQELVQDILALLKSFFWRGNEPHQPFISD